MLRMTDIDSKYNNMHKNGMFYTLIFINYHVIIDINFMFLVYKAQFFLFNRCETNKASFVGRQREIDRSGGLVHHISFIYKFRLDILQMLDSLDQVTIISNGCRDIPSFSLIVANVVLTTGTIRNFPHV